MNMERSFDCIKLAEGQVPRHVFVNVVTGPELTNWKPFGKRPAERPKNRWIDGILKDMEVLKVKNWKELSRNRKEWNKLVEKAKTHPGL